MLQAQGNMEAKHIHSGHKANDAFKCCLGKLLESEAALQRWQVSPPQMKCHHAQIKAGWCFLSQVVRHTVGVDQRSLFCGRMESRECSWQ